MPMSASSSAETFGRQQDCAIANANTPEIRDGASALSSPIEQARPRQAQGTENDRYCSGPVASAFAGEEH